MISLADLSLTRRHLLIRGSVAAGAAFGGAVHGAGRRKPLVLGHRGCSALRPEHTLASYAKAIADGADFIEPDLVATKDGVLVARHENNITETTDVAAHPEFAQLHAEKTVDGQKQQGWFTEDFSLAQLQTLRARERLPGMREESHTHDGAYRVATFAEILDFVAAEAAARGRVIGVIPEIKHSTYFASIGLPLEDRFMADVAASAYLKTAPLIVQSFEIANLKALRQKFGRPANVQLMQLMDSPAMRPGDVLAAGGALTYARMMEPAGLADIATYADYIAPSMRAIIPLTADGHLAAPSSLVADAHRLGLKVGCYTFRPENYFLAADFRNGSGPGARNPEGSVAEMRRYLATGIDAFFTDDPALGRMAVDTV